MVIFLKVGIFARLCLGVHQSPVVSKEMLDTSRVFVFYNEIVVSYNEHKNKKKLCVFGNVCCISKQLYT